MLFEVSSFRFDNWEETVKVDVDLGSLTVPDDTECCWFVQLREIDDSFDIELPECDGNEPVEFGFDKLEYLSYKKKLI
jgi:hypothetical protein